MNQNHRTQNIRTIIQIKRVWLAVRFNCKLSFIIRNELSEKIAEIDNTYNLFRGECLVNETLYFELPQEVLTNRCKKLKLIVMMISANGMVPAGFVNFNTHIRSPYEQFQAILPLERCEDSRAQIKFMHMYELCSKTPIENSFINQHLNRQDLPLYENDTPMSKIGKKSSHSVNRENVSANKYRSKEIQNHHATQRVNFSRPLVSPRMLTRNFEGIQSEKSIKINAFQRGFEDKITEEKEPLDSSINPLSKEQLMKEHQQYWLEIIRLQEELEHLKEENTRVIQQNSSLKGEAETLKQYYEGHEQKIHAFLGQIQQNSETIKKLEEKLEHKDHIIAKKQQLIKQLQESIHKQADLDEIMRVFSQQKSIAAHEQQILQEKVLFLQGQARRFSQENLELKEKFSACENKNYFLANNNEAQRHIIIELERKLAEQSKKLNIYMTTFEQEKQSIIHELHILRESTLQDQERLQGVVKLLQSKIEQKEQQALQNSQKEELAMVALSKHAESANELSELKRAYDNILDCSSIDQSKLRIFERELELSSREKEDLQFQMRRREKELSDLKGQIEELGQQNKAIQLKLIEYEANIAGKTTTIEELKKDLLNESIEKQQLAEKLLNIERQFEQLQSLLSKEVEQKNRMTIILTTLQENYKNVEQQRKNYLRQQEELINKNAELQRQIQSKEKENEEEKSQVKLQLQLKQQQLTQLIEKASNLQMDLESALNVIEQLKKSKNSVRDQYQDSYNNSMTALTLKNGKLEKELQDANQQLQEQILAKQQLSQKLQAKNTEIAELKGFTHNKLQENLKLIKERQELKTRLSNQEVKVIKTKELFESLNKENEVKIEQLKSELQFVTQILQRERQEKSDIEKEFELEKSQLPQIAEVGQMKQESFDSKQEEVNLEIESKVISSEENIKEEKNENNNKKKKKKR